MANTLGEFQVFLHESNDAAGRHRTQFNFWRGLLKVAERTVTDNKLTKLKYLQDNVAKYGVACTNVETGIGALQNKLAQEFPSDPEAELRSAPIENRAFLEESNNLVNQIRGNLELAVQREDEMKDFGLPAVPC
ncbi:MAG: hypothetical protein WD873_04750 [Candidatus Hydrogenedentales bacterium]